MLPRLDSRFGGRLLMSAATIAVATTLVSCGMGGGAQAQPVPDFARLDMAPATEATAPASMRAASAMVAIQAGRHRIGRDDGPDSQGPAHEVGLSAFRIDRTEVTNAAFVEFLDALPVRPAAKFAAGRATGGALGEAELLLAEDWEGSGQYPIVALDDGQSRIAYAGGNFVPQAGYADHPVTETTWAGARAYCAWRGARLPTEAEWEAAARNGDDRLYPWGNAAPSTDLAHLRGANGETAPVGSRPAGATPSGILDLSGNLAEWTSTLREAYPSAVGGVREDPLDPGERVTRGGDYRYDNGPDRLTTSHRVGFSNAPGRGHRHIGFRCAADATQQEG